MGISRITNKSHIRLSSVSKRKSLSIEKLYGKSMPKICGTINNAADIAGAVDYRNIAKVQTAALFIDFKKEECVHGDDNNHAILTDLVQDNMGWFESKGIFIDNGFNGYTNNVSIAGAPLSAKIAFDRYDITDIDVLRAIAHNQAGQKYSNYSQMSMLEKIIMISSHISNEQTYYGDLAKKVAMNMKDLDLSMLVLLTGIIREEMAGSSKSSRINGNILKLRGKLYDNFMQNRELMLRENIKKERNAAIKFIIIGTKEIDALSDNYMSDKKKSSDDYFNEASRIYEENIKSQTVKEKKEDYGALNYSEIDEWIGELILKLIDKAIELEGLTERILFFKRDVLLDMGREKEAQDCVEKMQYLSICDDNNVKGISDPDNLDAILFKNNDRLFKQAIDMISERKPNIALPLLDIVINSGNENKPIALIYKGCIQLREGGIKEALKSFNRAIPLLQIENPYLIEAYFYKVLILRRLNRFDEAGQCISDAKKADPKIEEQIGNLTLIAQGLRVTGFYKIMLN